MEIVTAAEMGACDRATSAEYGISLGRLMRAAAEAVAGFARVRFPEARRVTVLCGRGNNGGDGLHVARLLVLGGAEVTVLLVGEPAGMSELAAEAWRLLTANAALATVHVLLSVEDVAALAGALECDLIVDAIVGTGFRPPLRELPLAVLERVRASGVPVLAVDLPSGWDADQKGPVAGAEVFPADAVVTFTRPKPAHVFCELTRRWDQPIVVAPIGSPLEAVRSELGMRWAGAAKAITEPLRAADANKGRFGHVLVVGGSVGKSGAPAMAALAALRSGAGLVTAAVPGQVLPLVAGIAPELMTEPLPADGEELAALVARKTVLAIGPGLGTSAAAGELLVGLLGAAAGVPAVVDADGLNLLAADVSKLQGVAEGRTLVLTPHPGEMARLTGLTIPEVQADRVGVAREFAVRHGLTVVLKGWRTVIAQPDGEVAVNTSGNPAMAKGGSGDLLTGLIAGLLAQHPGEPGLAVEAAVYLHGLAGDLAVAEADQHTLLATDLVAYFSRAFRYLPQGPDGYCWLQGIAAQTAHARQG